jgi:hypothetical protein
VTAVEANLAFLDYLKGFKAHPEVARLYMAIVVEDIFKTQEGEREKAIQSQQKKTEELEAYLLKIDDMFVTGDLEKDSYRRLKENKQKELQKVQIELTNMRTTDTSFAR